jgi:hypothetical protein
MIRTPMDIGTIYPIMKEFRMANTRGYFQLLYFS